MAPDGDGTEEHVGTSAPLAGVTVLEIAGNWAAPFAGRLLSDYGADVIKVEDVHQPDPSRSWTPMKDGVALGFLRVNSNKRAIAVDLRTAEGQEVIRRLTERVDVLTEAFRPGRMAGWGLSSEVLRARNPRLVVAHMSGYGQTGPYRERPGFGTVAESVAGFAFVNGWPDRPPTVAPFGLGDSIAGMAAAFGIMSALFDRERSGVGRDVDVAIYEPLMTILGDVILRYSVTGEIFQRTGGFGKQTSPRGVYETADGKWVAIAGSGQNIVARLFKTMGRPAMIEDPRYSNNEARVEHDDELQAMLREWVSGFDRTPLLALLDSEGVAAGAVNDASDVIADPHFRARGAIVPLESKRLGSVDVPGLVAHLNDFDGPVRGDAPEHGEHTEAVLRELLGSSDEEISQLEKEGAVWTSR